MWSVRVLLLGVLVASALAEYQLRSKRSTERLQFGAEGCLVHGDTSKLSGKVHVEVDESDVKNRGSNIQGAAGSGRSQLRDDQTSASARSVRPTGTTQPNQARTRSSSRCAANSARAQSCRSQSMRSRSGSDAIKRPAYNDEYAICEAEESRLARSGSRRQSQRLNSRPNCRSFDDVNDSHDDWAVCDDDDDVPAHGYYAGNRRYASRGNDYSDSSRYSKRRCCRRNGGYRDEDSEIRYPHEYREQNSRYSNRNAKKNNDENKKITVIIANQQPQQQQACGCLSVSGGQQTCPKSVSVCLPLNYQQVKSCQNQACVIATNVPSCSNNWNNNVCNSINSAAASPIVSYSNACNSNGIITSATSTNPCTGRVCNTVCKTVCKKPINLVCYQTNACASPIAL